MRNEIGDLSSEFLPLACRFLAELAEARIFVVVLNTSRTLEDQADLYARGASKTRSKSKHLPRKVRIEGYPLHHPDADKSDAIDLAPVKEYKNGKVLSIDWSGKDPAWDSMGSIGESMGLVWGGSWRDSWDKSHFEMRLASPIVERDDGAVSLISKVSLVRPDLMEG